jgi:DNA ligase (NAD+)
MESEIDDIISRLKLAREAYYNLDPIIEDIEYDALKDRLRELDPFHEEVIAVGAEVPSDAPWAKIAHEMPMGSLDKVNTQEEFKEWALGTGASTFMITHKLDGSSLELVYENGLLQRCVTRGNGSIGEDITLNAIKIPNIPRRIENREKFIVRGEVIMTKKVFQEKYSGEYANPRNTAAGKLRDKKNQGEDCKNLEFIAFSMVGETVHPTEFFLIEHMRSLGFEVPMSYATGSVEDICKIFSETEESRTSIPYEIDGMVISVNNLQKKEALGEKNMRPLGQIAWKFDPATSISRVLDIKWQVGPTGRITPVASVEPVNIGGVTIMNISLHNLSLFKDLRLYRGCEVLISRRNDVIPYIEKNLSLAS